MKRPLFLLFILLCLGIVLFYPRGYQPDPVFPQGQYYTVTAQGRLKTYSRQQDRLTLTLSDCRIQHNGQSYQCPQLLVSLESSETSSLQAGDLLQIHGSLASFQPARNPGNYDWYAYYRARHISYRIYADELLILDHSPLPVTQCLLTLRDFLTDQLQQWCYPDTETASLLTALLLGDKTMLEEDTKAKYQDGGILHILTVSGLHVSLLGTAALTLGKKTYLPPWLRSLLSAVLVLLYWKLCGAGMSAGRAAIMFFCLTAAPLLGRSYDSLSALSLAGILLLWNSPLLLFQAGFQLSFGAILGIQLVCPALAPRPKDRATPAHSQTTSSHKIHHWREMFHSLLHKHTASMCLGLGLQLTMLPLTLYHFFRYPLYSIFLNLLALPLVPPLFLLGACGLLLYLLLPSLPSLITSWLLLPCRWILLFYDRLCTLALSLPGSSSLWGRPPVWRIVLFYLILVLFCVHRRALLKPDPTPSTPPRSPHSLRRCLLSSPVLVTLALLILLFPFPSRALSVVFLDVGQGDCAFLETPYGTNILIDSGSSDVKNMADLRLIPFLESRGIDHLDYVFLSHTDQDHISGFMDWLESGRTVGTVLLPALHHTLSSAASYQQILSVLQSYHIPICYFQQGMQWQEGELSLTCLAPVPPDDGSSQIYTDANTASMVLLAEYQDFRILFTGDCEKEGEALLVSYLQSQQITCHLLKAGHHGSTYATGQELLAQLQPEAVIISCGVRNRYGHPHPTMLERLQQNQIPCHVTASCGAVTVKIRNGTAQLEPLLPASPLYYR